MHRLRLLFIVGISLIVVLLVFISLNSKRISQLPWLHPVLASSTAQNQQTAVTQLFQKTALIPATGPLQVHPINPRYFTDGTGRVVYLTGAHTWSSFQDNGGSDPPPVFDYAAYLDFLEANNHNFFRLWTWEQARWTVETTDDAYWFNPMPPFQRSGPGMADDGKPKYDLSLFEQAYFDRLRDRVIQAGDRGIYVAIVLFNGWSVASDKGGFNENNPWLGHPFKGSNNINGIDGDDNGDNSGEETHELAISAVTAIQEAYVQKVIDTVNDLDNVLYEVSNESHGTSEAWQYHMINVIKTYEAALPKQHPVGMSVEWPDGDNAELYASPADWISPNGDINNPPLADGSKVILSDSDHLCGVCGDRTWVWKSFTQGENPVFMDGYDGAGYGVGGAGFDFNDPTWVSLRSNLGYTLVYANRMHLANMTPRGDLASSGYALANPASSGAEYLVYEPSGGAFTVDLSATSAVLLVEWLNPETGQIIPDGTIQGGAVRNFIPPFSGDAVLYLHQLEVSFATDSRTVNESAGMVEIDVLLDAPTPLTVTVSYDVTGGTAIGNGIDYTLMSGMLTFTPNTMTQTVNLTIIDDTEDELAETIELALTAPNNSILGTPATHTLTIQDNDEPLPPSEVSFVQNTQTVSEGDGLISVGVMLNNSTMLTLTVNYSVSGGTATGNGVDYTLSDGMLTFPPGQINQTIDIILSEDSEDEADETIELTLSDPIGGILGMPSSFTLTIQDNDEAGAIPAVSFALSGQTVAENSGLAEIDVILNDDSPLTVTTNYTVAGGTATGNGVDYALSEETLTFLPGELTQTIQITLTDDTLVEPDETAIFILNTPISGTLGLPNTFTLTIQDDDEMVLIYLPIIQNTHN